MERRKDGKTEWQKDRKIEKQKDSKTEKQKDIMTELQRQEMDKLKQLHRQTERWIQRNRVLFFKISGLATDFWEICLTDFKW